MIAHVAEADEARGRVIVRTTSARTSDIAIQAAVRIAQAYHSQIESLFIEDTELLALSRFSFAREISPSGHGARGINTADLLREMRFQFASLQRRLTELAKVAQVPVAERCVRDDPLRALAITCADCGPWNVVVLAEPFSASSGAEIARLLDNVEDATGLVLVGPRARRLSGPVVMMLEDIDALAGMLRAGDRLVEGAETELVLAIVPPMPRPPGGSNRRPGCCWRSGPMCIWSSSRLHMPSRRWPPRRSGACGRASSSPVSAAWWCRRRRIWVRLPPRSNVRCC